LTGIPTIVQLADDFVKLSNKVTDQQNQINDLEIAIARLALQINGSYKAPYKIPSKLECIG
jgi:hypothetical protein